MLSIINRTKNQTGDTLVEVMISIAIVALAIAISYAISGKNLNVGITARERTSAVGLVQGQIERMNEVQQINRSSLNRLKSGHNCFDGSSAVVTNPGVNLSNDNLTGGGNSYAGACVIGGKYFLDISYINKNGVGLNANGNSFAFTARWYRVGGGPDQIVTIYYRPW